MRDGVLYEWLNWNMSFQRCAGEDYSKYFKVTFMTIGDNPSGQATSTSKYVVITCARSKADEVKKWMREYFLLNEPYQELAGRMVG